MVTLKIKREENNIEPFKDVLDRNRKIYRVRNGMKSRIEFSVVESKEISLSLNLKLN